MNSEECGISRRKFLSNFLLAGSVLPFLPWGMPGPEDGGRSEDLEIHIFSKHLQFLGYEAMARAAADLGFDGVDLTVRPGGHVLPEKVENDLPAAVEAIRNAGLKAEMITTEVDDATDPVDRRVLTAAAEQRINYYRMNWFRYREGESIPESIAFYQKRVAALGTLNRKLGLVGCYQNHAGTMMGASLWELYDLLSEADTGHTGVQYDIRHATVEGGLSWINGLKLIRPYIKTLVIKDFKWVRENGEWKLLNTPLGEGMVDFTGYFQLLKQFGINVPVSMHLEYPIGGAEHGARQLSTGRHVVYDAMKNDLDTLRHLWGKA